MTDVLGKYSLLDPALAQKQLNAALAGGGGGGSGVLAVTVPLSANEINNLFSVPKTLIAAPGAGKAIVVNSIFSALTAGAIRFDSENGDVGIFYGSKDGVVIDATADLTFRSSVSKVGTPVLGVGGSYTSIENLPVVLAGTGENWILGGAIASSSVSSGGSGYAPGDTGAVNPQQTSIYVVDTVNGGGAVLTYHFSDAGHGNNVADGYTTNASTGGGSGFTINVTSISPGDGLGSVTIAYQIITLP